MTDTVNDAWLVGRPERYARGTEVLERIVAMAMAMAMAMALIEL